MEDLKIILDKMLLEVPNNIDVRHFVFNCSSDFKCDLKEYRGIKVYFIKFLPKKYIAYCPSIFAEDYNLI
jgi:hypothetical protein